LVVDDDPGVVELWCEVLNNAGFLVEGLTDPRRALARALAEEFDLVLSDVEMPGLRGPQLLQQLLAARPDQRVILITAFGSIPAAVDALQRGAADFVSKPCAPEALVHAVRKALQERTLRREVARLRRKVNAATAAEQGLIAASPAMRETLERARRVASARGAVLLLGETGTGKTALARYIHANGPSSEGPWVELNAATLPVPLAESELFGSRRGAFTDAAADRPGLIKAADGGSLFLDEITDLPLPVQAKLLTAVESGRVRAVGDTREQPVSFRLLAASNRSLAEAVEAGHFRADLRYRLEVLTLRLPPLRDRREDLEPLVDHYLDVLARRHGREGVAVAPSGWRWLQAWPWPGNLRELINRLERAVVFSDHNLLRAEDLADPAPEGAAESAADGSLGLTQLAQRGWTLALLEERYLRVALQITKGNKAEAARLLGIDRRTLYRKLGVSLPPSEAGAHDHEPHPPPG
jgi:DNA-binding NtrC family response regulator